MVPSRHSAAPGPSTGHDGPKWLEALALTTHTSLERRIQSSHRPRAACRCPTLTAVPRGAARWGRTDAPSPIPQRHARVGGVMSVTSARESAYAELVAGLLDARDDLATARFDAELAAAQDSGAIDAATARALRWWQRASVRAAVDHARSALPPVLAALDGAQAAAAEDLADAARALDDAMDSLLPAPRVVLPDTEQPGIIDDDETPDPDDEDSPPGRHHTEGTTTTDLTSRRLLVAGLTPLPPR